MKTMPAIINMKKICAVLLLISFFLPFSRGCSDIEIPYQEDSVKLKNKKPLLSMEVKKPKNKYVYDIIALPETSTLTAVVILFCYLWPIPILLFHRFLRKKKIIKYLMTSFELVFCIGTFYFVIMMAMFDKLLIGGYLAISSSVGYFCSTAFELLKEILFASRLE